MGEPNEQSNLQKLCAGAPTPLEPNEYKPIFKWERLILSHGLQSRTTTQTSTPWKSRGDTITCPLFGSREPCHTLYGKLDGNSNFFYGNSNFLYQKPRRKQQVHTTTPATTTTRGQTDLKHISGLAEEDCLQPNRGPEDSTNSRTRRSGKESGLQLDQECCWVVRLAERK